MESVWGVYVPAGAEEFPGPVPLSKSLRRCRCGQLTFLPLPCPNCGGRNWEPAFQFALRKAWTRRAGRWFLAVIYVLAAGYGAFKLWWPLALPVVGVTLAALAADLARRTPEGDICFWLFHDSARGRKKLPMADIARVGAVTDAYDADVKRLEQMLEADFSAGCAERVFYMAQGLAEVYHNRRVSALLAKSLSALPLSEGICVDLEQICAWLEPEDVPADILKKLSACACLTCLPPGEQTGRFTARYCGLQVQRYVEKRELKEHYTLKHIPYLVSSGDISLEKVLTKEQRSCLSVLWSLSGGRAAPGTAGTAPKPSCPEEVLMAFLPEGSRYIGDVWFWYAWFCPDEVVFADLDRVLGGSCPAVLQTERRGEQSVRA